MNWIITSIVLIISSTVLYTSLRNIDKYKTPIEVRNLAIFTFPILFLLPYHSYQGDSILLPFTDVVLLFFSALFLSWLANIASLRSLQLAPNPGYPLIIGKSYVIYTTIFSILFLGGEFSWGKIVAILCIVIFSSILLSQPTKVSVPKGHNWILLSIYTFFAWGNLALVLTYLGQKGYSFTTLNLYLLIFVTLFILGEFLYKRISYRPKNKKEIQNIILITLSFLVFQQSMVYGFLVSPNPGYINAANVGSIGIVTLVSGYLFQDELSPRQLLSIAGIIVALFFLFL